MTKRTVKVMEGEKVVYHGPEQRAAPLESIGQLFWKITVTEIIKIITVAVGVAICYQTIKADIKEIKSNQVVLTQNQVVLSEQMKKYQECQSNSDNWHSATTGQQFRCGEPVNTAMNKGVLRKWIQEDPQKTESN